MYKNENKRLIIKSILEKFLNKFYLGYWYEFEKILGRFYL